MGCPDKALNFHDPETVCLWWQVEGEHNPNSCFEDCSDRVLHYMEKKIHRACHEVEEMHHIYLRNGNTTHTNNTMRSDNTTYQDNEQHYQEDYHNTTSNDSESHHEHKEHNHDHEHHHDHEEHDHDHEKHDMPEDSEQHYQEDYRNTTSNDTESHHEHHHHDHEEHDHDHEEHDRDHEEHDMPECLKDCPFEEVDFNNPESACPWWHAEAPEHNTESCFNDCSPGIMYHIEHHMEQVCAEKPEETEEEQNPFECAMDCPIEGLDPHSAESFCPWFSQTKNNTCFYDCSDDFLNMPQAHAEHTCAEYVVEGAAKFTNYINEPLVDELVAAEEHMSCGAGFYQIAGYECKVCPAAMFSYDGDYECSACAEGMTSFPGAMSPE